MDNTPKKTAKPRLQLVISVLVATSLILAELYVMINQPANVVLMIGIAVLVLIAVYFVLDAVMDCVKEKEIVTREQYDNIYRSEKASYMLLRKNLEEISHLIQDANANAESVDVDEIVSAQKALAKITVNKGSENAKMIMARIARIEKALEANATAPAVNTVDYEKQDRLFIELNNLEASLNDRLQGLSDKLSGFQEEIERLADHIARINTEAISEALHANVESDSTHSNVVEEDTLEFDELDLADAIFSEESDDLGLDVLEDILDLDIPDVEETVVETEEDILSQLVGVEESELEEIDALEELAKAVDEIEEATEIELELEPEPVEEPEPAPAPVPTPAAADNGGKMGQDDIAALIASMTGGDAAPAAEPEPVPTPAPADNGGKMGQDDIAALIASMTGGDAAPVAEPEPEPAPAPAPADNGGKMDQDDIAALIASMTGGN